MNSNMMVKAIECVLRVNGLPLCGSDVTFKLFPCYDHYLGDDIYRLLVIRNELNEYSRNYEYLLKWDDEVERFLTSSEF